MIQAPSPTLFQLTSGLILAGGLGLLGIATSAAMHGVWSAALLIGACGLPLLGAVAWVAIQRRMARRP